MRITYLSHQFVQWTNACQERKGDITQRITIVQMDLIITWIVVKYIPANDQTHAGKLLQVGQIILL